LLKENETPWMGAIFCSYVQNRTEGVGLPPGSAATLSTFTGSTVLSESMRTPQLAVAPKSTALLTRAADGAAVFADVNSDGEAGVELDWPALTTDEGAGGDVLRAGLVDAQPAVATAISTAADA
jgi:hypothetical protein